MIRSRLIVISLFEHLRVQTIGSETSGSPLSIDIDAPILRTLLPHAESVTLVALTESPTVNFGWNIGLYSGYNRAYDNGSGMPVRLGADPVGGAGGGNAAGSKRHDAYPTVANFMLESRIVLLAWNTSTTTPQSAQLSAQLLVMTVGM